MTIDEAILAKALSMLRETPSDAEKNILTECCAAAKCELSGRLREGITVESIEAQFVRSAATLGLSMFLELSFDSVQSVRAGRTSVTKRGAGGMSAAARSLRRQAELMMTGYIYKNDFDFRAVRY